MNNAPKLFALMILAIFLHNCVTERGDVWDKVVENYVTMTSTYKEEKGQPDQTSFFDKGVDAFNEKRYQEAQLLLARFVNANPGSDRVPEALFYQGECFYRQGVYLQAVRYYQTVIDRYPSSPVYLPAYLKKGYVYVRIDKAEEARKIFDDIVERYPNTKYAEHAKATLISDGRQIPDMVDQIVSHEDHSPKERPAARKAPLSEKMPSPSLGLIKGYAVVVGISNYKEGRPGQLENLLYADEDAKAFENILRKLGWNPNHIKLLINEEATRRNIVIALDSWLTKAGPNDLVVLFWSGHGFADPEDPEKVYFACYDTNINIPATGYRMDFVRRSLEEKKAKHVLVFADTCHAGKLITRGEKGISIVPQIEKMRKERNIPKGWIFMVGADTDRQAIEHSSWTNGAFTHCLLKGFAGEADGFESAGPKDGIVTMGELRSYLHTTMPDITQKVLGVAKRAVITTSSGDPEIWKLSIKMR